MVGKRSYGKRMGSHLRRSRISKIRTSERTKLLEQGIALKKRLDKKGGNLSNKDMAEALHFSKAVDRFTGRSGKRVPEGYRECEAPGCDKIFKPAVLGQHEYFCPTHDK